MRIEWSPDAVSDLKSISEYVEQDRSLETANRVIYDSIHREEGLILRFAELVDKQCGAGFSLRGTSVPLERRAATCGRRAEVPPQAEACPTLRHCILSLTIFLLVLLAAAAESVSIGRDGSAFKVLGLNL